ncbi:cation:proton antiporter [Cocleimonas sp. KMM 6892]|uniref:cation:proton antiporter n=1 Tax=unclassified Cocleimonas TaxID=2639732 RepID=UPI002DB5A459|nr:MULTISPECIES: cation:proton antiporter [unclassified Cocleimonas]MEB8433267.1 cation:proton antiporter [Cocleimonas sp. KMM 6892]MEC4715752.1 cation:proton antiporter [Cocleimonas sp. KMM 6895]MEC4745213.1 cation:proton antiporter [Cocleimonas sp. KMM 6896]
MDIVLITTIISALFLVIAAAEPLAARLNLPFSAILAILGILIGGGATFFLNTELTDALNPVAEAILNFPIRSNVFLYVFLPTLLFQATLGMNLRRMLDDWVPILVLAVVAVVVATFTVGYALSWVSTLPLMACLLIGAIVSTTDPSAVVTIFRSIAAPKRLARIIEGESLLNDAAAIALTGVFLTFVTVNLPNPTMVSAFSKFPVLIIGGVLTGLVSTYVALWIMTLFAQYERAIISVSVALPYMAYIGAEQTIGASGVIAVVTAGLTLKLVGPSRVSPFSWTNLRETWDLLAHWAGALIFILAALLIPRMLETVRLDDIFLVMVVVVAAIVARAVILFGLMPLMSSLRLSPKVEMPYRAAILWGGLRGAVTLALALAVTESQAVPVEIKRVVGILATGFTLFTLLVQGTTLRWVISLLKLDRLSPVDQALSNQVVAVALQTVREDMGERTKVFELPHEIVRSEAKKFASRVDDAVHLAEGDEVISDRDRITLGLVALAVAERNAVLERIRERTFPLRLAERAISDVDGLIDGARTSGRTGYQRAAKKSVDYRRVYRVALFLHNRLRWSAPLARIIEERFEVLLSQSVIFGDLEGFINARIKRLHGRRVAGLLQELLSRRKTMVETALEGLRLQFPGYAEELGRNIIQRTALRLEEREYDSLREQSLVGEELYITLVQDIASRREIAEHRLSIDLSVQRAELIKQYPLFTDLDEASLKRLARNLQSRYVGADTVIINKDSVMKKVYFIASGAVEIESAGRLSRLGRGEIFGVMTLLSGKHRRIKARTIVPSTLLVLDETKFRRLLERSPKLQQIVNDTSNVH